MPKLPMRQGMPGIPAEKIAQAILIVYDPRIGKYGGLPRFSGLTWTWGDALDQAERVAHHIQVCVDFVPLFVNADDLGAFLDEPNLVGWDAIGWIPSGPCEGVYALKAK